MTSGTGENVIPMQPSEWHAKYNGNDAGVWRDEPKCIEASDQNRLRSLWGVLKDADISRKMLWSSWPSGLCILKEDRHIRVI